MKPNNDPVPPYPCPLVPSIQLLSVSQETLSAAYPFPCTEFLAASYTYKVHIILCTLVQSESHGEACR